MNYSIKEIADKAQQHTLHFYPDGLDILWAVRTSGVPTEDQAAVADLVNHEILSRERVSGIVLTEKEKLGLRDCDTIKDGLVTLKFKKGRTVTISLDAWKATRARFYSAEDARSAVGGSRFNPKA